MSSPNSFIPIRTGLRLRPLSLPQDEALIIQGMTDSDLMQYYGVSYADAEAAQAQFEWYRMHQEAGTGHFWVVDLEDSGIGVLGIYDIHPLHRKAELGIWILKSFGGKGLGTGVVSAITDYAFQYLNLHRLEAKVELENLACRKMFTNAGWQVEGIQNACEWKNARWISLECWAIIQAS